MTGKERVRNAFMHEPVDRVPAYFESTEYVRNHLIGHYGLDGYDALLEKYDVDIREIEPAYIGPARKRIPLGGRDYKIQELFGEMREFRWSGIEYNEVITDHPLKDALTPADVERMVDWPKPEWFDYESIKYQLDRYEDYAAIFGHWGPFSTATYLYPEEKMYLDMALNPELVQAIFRKMHEFELMHYENILKAGEGRIDILRPHDDYGSQRGLLFSIPMWKEYFADHTRELADLAHSYGAFYQQHSCGAVHDLIPELIACGVDGLEPIQPVVDMEPEKLYEEFGRKICFIGGIDTQDLLPNGTQAQVQAQVRRYMRALHAHEGGYILYPSQAWESCVPVGNIEAFYEVER